MPGTNHSEEHLTILLPITEVKDHKSYNKINLSTVQASFIQIKHMNSEIEGKLYISRKNIGTLHWNENYNGISKLRQALWAEFQPLSIL